MLPDSELDTAHSDSARTALLQAMQSSRIVFMGCPMDALTLERSVDYIEQAMATKNRLQHVVVNVAKLVNAQSDSDLRRDVEESDLINIDGMGVVWGARLCGHDVPERVTGIDLMHATLKRCEQRGFKPYFFGAKQEILETAVAAIQSRFPTLHIAGYRNGYFKREEEAAIMQDIAASGADCLFIAISSPTKERLLATYKESLGVSFLMGVGGSIDVIAGHVKRAPQWMQTYGLEWLYRIIQEPGRMWKRYLVTNSKYALLLIKEKFGL